MLSQAFNQQVLPNDLMSQSDMSVCEQSFHFSQTAKGGDHHGLGLQSEYAASNFPDNKRGHMIVGGHQGPKSAAGSVLFANLDDAKTLS